MSDSTPSQPQQVTIHLPPPPLRSTLARALFVIVILASFALNLLLCLITGLAGSSEPDEAYPEKVLYGDKRASDKIAVIKVEGVLMEGMINYPLRQIEKAMKDDRVKAVVLRIDSPGGTISASEELHKQLIRMRDGKSVRHPDARPKKLVVSMGALAASGGYYIAMPAEKLFADRTTLTGSIGVYAALPNVSEMADKVGFKMELIKAGAIKASGSPFHELTPQERQPWQEMVDHAYERFLDVVAEGRPALPKASLREVLYVEEILGRDDKGNVKRDWWGLPHKALYSRYRADGGTFTADQAKQYGLVDAIGDLEDAVEAAASSAGSTKYKVVVYDRPPSLLNDILGVQAKGGFGFDAARLASGFTPRLWYLVPQANIAGILTAAGRE
jgi:protease IV